MEVQRTMTRQLVSCRPGDTLELAARRMRTHDVGALPVVADDGRLVGMITDRDVCMSALARGRPLCEISVRAAMTREVVALGPDHSLAFAAELMGEFRVRRLPVVDPAGHPVGVLSLADLARRAACGEMRSAEDVGMDDVTTALSEIARPRAPLPASAPAQPVSRQGGVGLRPRSGRHGALTRRSPG